MVTVTFDNPLYLWYLVSVPLLIATHFYFLRYAKFRSMRFANFEALKRVSGEKLMTKNFTLLFLRTLILVCLVLAAAGPTLWYKGESSINDFVIALDVSASMTAQDVEPTRLEAAKNSAMSFLDTVEESGIRTRVGLLTFSGSTYIEEMVTDNTQKLRDKLEDIEVRREGGTDMAGALVTSTNMLLGSEKGKAIILISDGSITVSTVEDDALDNALAYALSEHVIVHTLGVGTETGPLGYLPEYYNASAVFNEQSLLNLANSTLGTYHKINNANDFVLAYQDIADASDEAIIDFDTSYGLLLVVLFLIFIEWGFIGTKFRRLP